MTAIAELKRRAQELIELERAAPCGARRVMLIDPETVHALIADGERLHKALRDISAQVELNIRETVRDCVNGRDDVQDIYGYCDEIDALIEAALVKGAES